MILLNPGPVNVSERVRRAMVCPDMCHREPEFDELLQDVRRKVLGVYGLDASEFSSVLMAGSGTAAVESTVLACVGRDERLLVVSNGVYGERMAEMAACAHIPYEEIRFEWGEEIDLRKVEAVLADGSFSALATVHHETTTGVLNNIGAIAAIAKQHGARVVIDAVSSFGGEEMDFSHIDFAATTANKCLHGVPGVAIVVFRPSAVPGGDQYVARSCYLDLRKHYVAQDHGDLAFTPGIPALHTLREALNEMRDEGGVAARIGLFRGRAALIRSGCTAMGLELFCDPVRMSATLTSIMLPDRVTYEWLHDELKARGFVVYAGQAGLKQELFRVANMGSIPYEDLDRFLEVLAQVVG